METLLEDLCAQFLSGSLTFEEIRFIAAFIVHSWCLFHVLFFLFNSFRLTDSSFRFYESDYYAIKTENINSITEPC